MNWGLPASVEIGGVSYEIRTDFRVILDIFVMLSDPDLSGTDRAEGILQMFYVSPKDIPPQQNHLFLQQLRHLLEVIRNPRLKV